MAVVRATGLVIVALVFFGVVAVLAPFCRPGGRAWRIVGSAFSRVALRLLRVRLVVTGQPAAAGPVLLAANHVSWLDPLVFGAVAPFTMLAKREVGSWPVVASFARLQDTVLVDRARRMQVPAVNRALAERLAAGHSVLFFPEGTTHDGTRRGRFLTSHFASLADLMRVAPGRPARAQAAAIRYSDPAAAWVGDATLLPHLWTILRGPALVCHVAFGAPVTVAPGFNRKVLARDLAAAVEAMLATSYDKSRNSPADSPIGAGDVSSQAASTCLSAAG